MILVIQGDTHGFGVELTLVDKEGGIPDERVVDEWDDIHPEGAVRFISQRSILEGDGGTRGGTDRRGASSRFTRCRFLP